MQKGLLTTAGFTLLAGLLMNMALPVPDGHAVYPAEERLHVLFIGPAHGYDGVVLPRPLREMKTKVHSR